MSYKTFFNNVPIETERVICGAIEIFSIIEDIDFKYFNRRERIAVEELLPLSKSDKVFLSIFLAALRYDESIKVIFEKENLTTQKIINSINEKNDINIVLNDFNADFEIDYNAYYDEYFNNIIFDLNSVGAMHKLFPEILVYNSALFHISNSSLISSILVSELGSSRANLKAEIYMRRLKREGERDKNGKFVPKFDRSKTLKNNQIEDDHSFAIERESNLKNYGVIMTDKNYKFNPAIGRDKEIEKVLVSLLTDEVSPILVGEAGVGKTAIVEGLAYRIKNGLVPSRVANKKIVKLNISSLVAGCKYVGMFQERIEEIMAEAKKDKNTVLFIDEIHSAIGAGAGSSQGQDLANILKPYIDRGDVKIIGATTTDEYHEYIAKDPAFKRRFEKVDIPELGKRDLMQVVSGVIKKVEEATSVKWNANIDFKYNVISDILDATSKEKRVYDDMVNNPDLVLKIVKKAFAYAQLEDSKELSINHFVKSIDATDRIYPNVREAAVSRLMNKYSDELGREESDNVIQLSRFRKIPTKY